MAELVDALVLGTSGATRESSSLSFRTNLTDLTDIQCLARTRRFGTAANATSVCIYSKHEVR